MPPVLLMMSATPPLRRCLDWYVIWCVTTPQMAEPPTVDEVLVLPKGAATLCALLLTSDRWSSQQAVALCTNEPVILPDPQAQVASAWLQGPDSGLLFFPRREQADICVKAALRRHNPATGQVTLTDGWHQALLAGLNLPV